MKLITNSKVKQYGVLLIIIGAFIPSILYPFSSLSNSAILLKAAFASEGVSYDTRIQDLEIVFAKGEWIKGNNKVNGHYKGRLAIPYKYILAFGILLAFVGIGIIAFHKNGNGTNESYNK